MMYIALIWSRCIIKRGDEKFLHTYMMHIVGPEKEVFAIFPSDVTRISDRVV